MGQKTQGMHGRDHASTGADPIPTSTLFQAQASSSATTVATPWTHDKMLALGGFSGGGTGNPFSLDSTTKGIATTATCWAIVSAYVLVYGSGTHAIPPRMRLVLMNFTSGSAPSDPVTAGTYSNYGFSDVSLPAGPTDNDDGTLLAKFNVHFVSQEALLSGKSYGLAFQAVGAAADWKFDCQLFIKQITG